MKNIFLLICLFFSTFAFAQTTQDSMVLHLPNKINCDTVVLFLDGVEIDTQALTPLVTDIDYTVYGFTTAPSDYYFDYTMIIRDYYALAAPREDFYIVPRNCFSQVYVYKKYFQNTIVDDN